MRARFPLVIAAFAACLAADAGVVFAQGRPIDRYLDYDDARVVAAKEPRSPADVGQVLPERQASRFADYVREQFAGGPSVETLRQAVERLRLNKIVGSGVSGAGTTSLVSHVAVPGVVGFATEYGGILRNDNGGTSTLRANVLGLANVLLGATQFPYCPEIDARNCQPASRWLRRFSVAASFEGTESVVAQGTAVTAAGAVPVGVDLGGSDFRMASWSARFDLTSNDPESPQFVRAWRDAIAALRGGQAGLDLTQAINDLFAGADGTLTPLYTTWRAETVRALASVPAAEFSGRLGRQLDVLIARMASDPAFMDRVAAVSRASRNYFDARDAILRAIQRHRLSVEVTNLRAEDRPWTSTWRLIYSHQPSKSPTLLTANVAVTVYPGDLRGVSTSRLRDVQFAVQLDRRLGAIPTLGHAVASIGGYYQWMRDDALITIGPGNVAPGTAIVLPDTAAKLLGTRGGLGIFQAKITVPISSLVRVPCSVTWSNRTELATDWRGWRGQVGFTLDLDSLFK